MPMVQRMVKTEKAMRHRGGPPHSAANFHSLHTASLSSWQRSVGDSAPPGSG